MKLYFDKNLFKENIKNILRKCGYAEIYDRQSGNTSYVRRLGAYFYPRFHLYIEELSDKLTFNLHLDQKKASYHGQTAHSGEYDDELVQGEAKRIEDSIKS